MKYVKVILASLMMMLAFTSSYAAKPNSEDVENFKASVMAYLRTEGYRPTIDSDGDVKFKHDGYSYWVSVEAYDDGYYVELMTITNCDSYNLNTILRAIDETVRSLKFVRQYTISDGTAVDTEYCWYCTSISDFKKMFENALLVVSTADERFIGKLN